jgi:hypothetical protein
MVMQQERIGSQVACLTWHDIDQHSVLVGLSRLLAHAARWIHMFACTALDVLTVHNTLPCAEQFSRV